MSTQSIGAGPDAPHETPRTAISTGMTRSGAQRIDAIDRLRGLVIILMVLDHVRDFFHRTALLESPLALDSGDPGLFLTRWITHLCAPVFVFLAGTSIFLQQDGGRSRGAVSLYLLTRGAWLILLELTLVRYGFNFGGGLVLQVIWALGAAMIAMAMLIWAPRPVLLVLGALIVLGHPLLAPVEAADVGALAPVWSASFEFGPGLGGFVVYPFVPWLGVMLVGYGAGPMFNLPERARTRSLLMLAAALLVLFALLRVVNGYGDPRPWSVQEAPLWTALSFLNVAKYPPSPDFVLVTLGLALAASPLLERLKGPPAGVLLTFGRTSLFTYVLHVYVAHGLALAVGMAMGVSPGAFFNMLDDPGRLVEAGWGFGLGGVYVAWLAVLALLYPLSRWLEGLKRRRRDWWLGYL